MHERWRTELVLNLPGVARAFGYSWVDLCNRGETLARDAAGTGRVCTWRDSSTLTVTRVFPHVGARLLRHALRDWPIRFERQPREDVDAPEVAIVIPIGGSQRLSQFELALAAARAQDDVTVEVIVVEQSARPELRSRLPEDVRYVHQPSVASGFNKSWALNRGAREARADVLVLLDADMLLPRRFAAECRRALRDADAVRPARLLFCLDRASSEAVAAGAELAGCSPERVVANTPMPLAVRRAAYWQVGGHDEAYFGWGGEDTEFLDRLRTRRVREGGWLPVVHVWHEPATQKADGDRNSDYHRERMALDARARIEQLTACAGGGGVPTSMARAQARAIS